MTRVFLSDRPSVRGRTMQTARKLLKMLLQKLLHLYSIFMFYVLYFIFHISYFDIFGLLVFYFSLTLVTNDILIEVLFVMLRSL